MMELARKYHEEQKQIIPEITDIAKNLIILIAIEN